MTRAITRQIVGYDPATDRVAFEQRIPTAKWEEISLLVKSDADDPEFFYAYPLDLGVANDIMGLMGRQAERNLTYFLECHSQD